mmetsp:Transcript_11003/g.26718  ORF Transcript_11003/g.26718 Transcript_11003/m.26718 type:complete len:361 (+) Transcript_11003:54-1136(+)
MAETWRLDARVLLLALAGVQLAGAFNITPSSFTSNLSPRATASARSLLPSLQHRGRALGKAALRCAAEPARSEWAELRREALKGLLVPPFPALEVPRVSLAAGESVLVVGARGGIGSAVVLELLQQGAVVRAFTRDPELVANAQNGPVKWVLGDLNAPATIAEEALEGVSRIIFCPGARGRQDPENNRRVYEEAIPLLLAKGMGKIERFVYLSSTGIAQTKPYKSPFFAAVYKYKRRGEAALRNSGTPYAIVRVNSTFKKAEFEGPMPATSNIVVRGDDNTENSIMYAGNLAAVLVDAAFHPAAAGKSFGVATNVERHLTERDIDAWKDDLMDVVLDSQLTVPWLDDYDYDIPDPALVPV